MNDYSPHANRSDYLASLAVDYGIDLATVTMMADLLGPSEDFDGLVSALDDYADELERQS